MKVFAGLITLFGFLGTLAIIGFGLGGVLGPVQASAGVLAVGLFTLVFNTMLNVYFERGGRE